MHKTRNRFIIGCVLMVAFVGVGLFQIRNDTAQTGGHGTTRAVAMLRLTNAARDAAGVHRLDKSHTADKLARVHSQKMADRGKLFHSTGYSFRTWGENIGVGSTVYGLFKAFMHSPEHRHIMLHKGYRHLGIGFVRQEGVLWVTMVFYG